MLWWGLLLVAIGLLGSLWLKRLRRRAAVDPVDDLVRLWFGARGINPATLMFNIHDDARLARHAQAIVMVGVGTQYVDAKQVGFVVEIEPGVGVVEGALLQPANLVLRDRAVAHEAKLHRFKLMDGLLELQRQVQRGA